MRRTLWLLALVLAAARPAAAQTPFFHQGLDPLHPPDSALPNEQVDPASGTLTIVAPDLVLPGNAGFNLAIQRVYNSSIFPNYDSGSTDVEERSWAGVGWKLHFGRILHADSQTAGQMEVEMGDGSRHPLYHSLNNPNIWTTSDFWLYNPATAVLQLPNGQVYTFGRDVYLNAQLGDVRYVTQITDPFGNAITFTYFTASDAPLDGIASIHQVLSATESRDVTFTYDSTLHALASMTYLNHTWTYTQSPYGADGDPLLVTVTPPQGPSTSYDYSGPTGALGEITSILAPFGGTIAYTYQDATRVASTYSTKTRVVATRTMSGHDVPTGTWTFAYGQGSNHDTTVITCPCGGTTSYRFNGTGTSGDFSGWSAGTLAEISVVDGPRTLDDRTMTWTRSDAISNDPVTGPNGVWSDAAVYRPLLATQAVMRDGHTWTTTNTYHTGDGSLNDFGQPYDILEQGETIYQTRETTRTFQTGFAPYIVGRLASETVSENSAYGVNDGTTASSWTYDLATGFLTAETRRGITTTFEARTDGNVNAVVDARTNRTTFGYDWGRVSSIQTPNTTTTLVISPEGLVTSQTRGDLTTTYGYDLALRLSTQQPPGTNSINYGYDDLHGTWLKVVRGGSTIEQDVDAFGRAIRTFNSQGLITGGVTRDTCGRVTNASDPYTTTPLDQGTSTVYDALGRATQVTDPAGHVTTYGWSGINVTRADANTHVTTLESMAFGDPSEARLVRVFDAAGGDTHYVYDVTGTLTRVTGPASGISRTWTVDGRGLVTSETQPESGTTAHTYDAVGNLASTTDANNNTTTFTYDTDNRLTNRDAPGTDDDLAITYDSSGRVHTLTGGGSTTTYTYDVANRTVSRSDVTAAGTLTSTYQDDANDNLAQITYPTGRLVAYSYDAENNLTAVNYTAPGSQTSTPFATNFSYGPDGRLASFVTGAVTHQFTYANARVQHLFTTGGTDTLDLTYAYDNAGNVTGITDPRPGGSESFATDALDRLTTANGPWGSLTWTYDGAGNRLTQTSGAGTANYAYSSSTQRLTSISGSGAESFTYDNVGQLTSDGLISQYTYSPTGKLTSATGSGVSVTYSYDATGERLSSTVSGQTFYTIRGIGGETLSEYLDSCGTAVWSRDLIYAGGQLLGAAKATTTIPSVAMTSATVPVGEAAGVATVNVQVSTPGGGALGCPVTVSYATADGGALAGADYTAVHGSVTFPSGSASGSTKTISVPIVNDAINEADENFYVNLIGADGAALASPAQTIVTVQDDDPPPTVSIADTTVTEGTGTGGTATFTISLSSVSEKAVTVAYATADGTARGTATSGFDSGAADYFIAAGTVTIPARSTTATVSVSIIGDYIAEPNETFVVSLSSPTNATLGTAQATATIVDDDVARKTWGDFAPPPPTSIVRDGAADAAVFDPSTDRWRIADSNTGALWTYGPWGDTTTYHDIFVPGDYDGDGLTDFAVYRPYPYGSPYGTWYVAYANGSPWNSWILGGQAGDIPVPGDYDGDGKTDFALYRPSEGYWHLFLSSQGWSEALVEWGSPGDDALIPVPADYDGDGKTDVAYYNPPNGYWYIVLSTTGVGISVNWGETDGSAVPAPGDYDGDGKADEAFYNTADHTWYINQSRTGTSRYVAWGIDATDVPVPADYDGDGITDIAFYHPGTGTFYIIQSSTGRGVAITMPGTSPSQIPVLRRPQ